MAVEHRTADEASSDSAGPNSPLILTPLDEPETANGARLDRVLPFSVALVAVTLTYWTIDILSPALPDIKDDLALSAAGTGLVFSLLFLGRLVANLPAAYLVDRIGAATTAAIGGALLTSGSLAASLAGSSSTLFPARILQGLGISLLVNATLRSILRAKPGQGAAMTLFGFAATIGGVLGLQSGGILTESVSWRAVFALCVGLSAFVTVGTFLARRFGPISPPPDALPTTLSKNVPTLEVSGSIAPAIILNFLVFGIYSVWVALPLYTGHHFNASAEVNANLLLVITVMHLIAAFPVGRAIRKWGGKPILIFGLLLAGVGTVLVLPMPGIYWLIVPMAIFGVGMVAAANAGGDIVLQRGGLSGRAVGMVRLSSDLGLVVGPFLTGAFTDAFGYRAPFAAIPIVALAAAFLALRERTPNRSVVLA